MLESENSRDKLARAGYRGQAPMIAFMFFRFVMPFIVFVVTLFYLFVITKFQWPVMMKVSAAFAGALFGLLSARHLHFQHDLAAPAIHHARLSRMRSI